MQRWVLPKSVHRSLQKIVSVHCVFELRYIANVFELRYIAKIVCSVALHRESYVFCCVQMCWCVPNMSIVVKDYTTPVFSCVLSATDRARLVDLIETCLRKLRSVDKSIPYVHHHAHKRLPDVYHTIDDFFKRNPGKYFLRLSTLSPKDASLYLLYGGDEDRDAPVADRLSVLCVQSVKQCFEVLCHSQRAFIDLEYESCEESIELLPWKSLDHSSEVRAFVRNGRVQWISQYYCDDFSNFMGSPEVANAYLERVMHWVNGNDLFKRWTALGVDVGLTKDGSTEDDSLTLIELNAWDDSLDLCLFDECDDKSIQFRYLSNGIVQHKFPK